MKNIIIAISSSIVTLLITISLLFFMKSGKAEIVVGDVNGINVGVIESYSGSTAPTGYLLCNGQAVSRSTYAELFKIIGTTYGTGDGSTTFNLPNLNGRVLVGKSSSTFTTLGSTGGNINTTLTTSNLPSHSHSIPALTGTTASAGAHTHKNTATSSTISGSFGVTTPANHCNYDGGVFTCATIADNSNDKVSGTIKTGPVYGYSLSVTPTITVNNVSAGTHTHTVSTESSTTGSTGSTSSFTNMQPYIVVNYIIKY